MAVIKLFIRVAQLENVLTTFNRIKVYRSATIGGTYAEITDATSRIRLEQGVAQYLFDDGTGAASNWYKTSYFHSGTDEESGLSDPRQGEDFEIDSLVLSVQELKDVYLFGLDLTDDAGNPYPDVVFEWSIKFAVDWLEKELDIKLRPTRIIENYDYYRADYQSWVYIKTRQGPIIDDLRDVATVDLPDTSLTRVEVIWPSRQRVLEFDQTWIKIRPDIGHINIIPAAGTLSQVLLTSGGSFLPLLAEGRDFVPDLFKVSYTAGFASGTLPFDLREIVGKKASFGPLNIAGDLLGGAGIASQSIGIDGLSQSFNTTSSATNAGYGARLLQYSKEIKEQIPTLRRFYKGIPLVAV